MRLHIDVDSDPPRDPDKRRGRWVRLLVWWLSLLLLIIVGNLVFEISLIDSMTRFRP